MRLWPAGLNWHFGAETDLFNLHCVFFSVRLKTHRVTFDFHPDLPHFHEIAIKRVVIPSNRLFKQAWFPDCALHLTSQTPVYVSL